MQGFQNINRGGGYPCFSFRVSPSGRADQLQGSWIFEMICDHLSTSLKSGIAVGRRPSGEGFEVSHPFAQNAKGWGTQAGSAVRPRSCCSPDLEFTGQSLTSYTNARNRHSPRAARQAARSHHDASRRIISRNYLRIAPSYASHERIRDRGQRGRRGDF